MHWCFAKFTPLRLLYFNVTLNFAGLAVSEPLIRPPGSKVQISIPTLARKTKFLLPSLKLKNLYYPDAAVREYFFV